MQNYKNIINRQVALLGLMFILLAGRFLSEIKLSRKFRQGQKVELNFCLTNQPYYTRNKQHFYYQNHFQKIKIKTDLGEKYDYGDCLQIKGKIVPCPNTSSIKYCLLNPHISTYDRPLPFQLLKKLRQVREKLTDYFLKNLPYPYSDLLAGIVWGVKSDLGDQLTNQLRKTGTLHIVVASGYNLTVSGEKPIRYLAYLIGRRPAVLIGFLFIWFYISLVGWQPPVVRAGILLSVILVGQLVGRKLSQLRGLLFTVWLMLIFKPDLITSISFQLSFAALLGIVIGEKVFSFFKRIPIIGKSVAETLSAQLLVAPIISYHFGSLSVLAPLTNGLILVLIPYLTWGGISAILGSFLPPLGRFILLFTYPILWWPVAVVRWFSQFSITEIKFSLPFWGVVGYYLILFLVFHIKLTTGEKPQNSYRQQELFSQLKE